MASPKPAFDLAAPISPSRPNNFFIIPVNGINIQNDTNAKTLLYKSPSPIPVDIIIMINKINA